LPSEVADDPTLDRQAELHGSWPRTLADRLPEGPVSLTDSQALFLMLDRHFQTNLREVDFEHYACDPEHSPEVKESVLRAIRAVVCLFGQRGLDEILLFDEAQNVLRDAPSSVFGGSGALPNIHLPFPEAGPHSPGPPG